MLTGERVATFPYDDTNEPDEIMLINKDTYAKVVYGECLKVYTVGDSNPCYETEIALSRQDDIIPCTYKDSICIFYKNGNVEMYSIDDTFKLIKSFYSMDGLQGAKTKLIYYPEKDIYVMTYEYADCTYVLNSNFEQIALLPATAFYIEEENKFISYGNFDSYMIPFYSYEELIKMADEKLGIYHPSQRIINQFNIK